MNNRIFLAIAIIFLWIFLILWRIYLTAIPSTLIILGFIIIYCLILALSQLVQRHKRPVDDLRAAVEHEDVFVNIFIPAHNEEEVLKATLENLVQIDYPNYDIWVIDDRSIDKTSEVARQMVEAYPDKINFFKRPEDSTPGKSAVLNDALARTNGEVICVFDADAKVKTDFLKSILPCLADKEISAVQARKIISNKDETIYTNFQNLEYAMDTYIQLGRNTLKGAVELRGNGQLVKRAALEAVEGWNLNTITDDLDLSTKLHLAGFDVRFCADVPVYEEAIPDIKSIYKQRKRWAEGSIRRYLDYFPAILTKKRVTSIVILDMLAYFSEFVLPIWLISDSIIQLIIILNGGNPEIMTNLLVITVLLLLFINLLFISIRKFENLGFFKALWYSILTTIYIILLWTVVVVVVVIKILFKNRDFHWYKTNHVGSIKS